MIYCPTCGAGLRFDIASQQMVCSHCANHFDPQSLHDNTANDAKTAPTIDSCVFVCPSCGGALNTTDRNDAVGFCPYCGGASMIFEKMRRDWAPASIVPFRITKEQCKELYCAEVKKHLFVSKKFRDPALIEGFRGIYMPYCSFRGELDGPVLLKAETDEKDIGNYHYQTLYFDVHGNAQYTVTGGLGHDASVAYDDHISEQLDPYFDKGSKPFHPAYLSGFYAEIGDIDINELGPVVWEEMKPVVCKAIEQDPEMRTASLEKIHIKADSAENRLPLRVLPRERKLLPVWFMSYRRGNKISYAAVNGQTGKVAADLPLSPLRILIAALLASVAVFGLLFLVMGLLPTLPAATTLGVCALLELVGMYLLQDSYLNTVGKALQKKDLSARSPVGFLIWSGVALVNLILMTTDGTYEQTRRFIGCFGGIASLAVLFFLYFLAQTIATGKIKQIKLTSGSMLANGLLVEAKKFNVANGIMRGVMLFTVLCFLPFIINGTWGSVGYYSLAAVAAAELIALALMHIFFQTRVAMRPIPQFNKKGAAYDEK